jgi:hypothetical protein
MPTIGFYRLAARHYTAWAAAMVPNPITRMAEEAQVDRRTASAWVTQARRHGFLPPATGRRKTGPPGPPPPGREEGAAP